VRKIEDDVEGRVKGRTQKNNLGILGLSSWEMMLILLSRRDRTDRGTEEWTQGERKKKPFYSMWSIMVWRTRIIIQDTSRCMWIRMSSFGIREFIEEACLHLSSPSSRHKRAGAFMPKSAMHRYALTWGYPAWRT
jgi:hypothetical protein